MAVYWDHSIEHEVEIIKVLIDSGKVNWDQTCPNQDHSVPLYEAVSLSYSSLKLPDTDWGRTSQYYRETSNCRLKTQTE